MYGPAPVSARKVASLIRWLPPDAALWRSLGTAWDTRTELAALTVEMLDAQLRAFVQANSKKGTPAHPPMHIPRPWEAPEKAARRGTGLSELIGNVPVRASTSGGQ